MSFNDLLETERDRLAFDALTASLKRGSTLAFVGAGFSARAGYPMWSDLLIKLSERARVHTDQMKTTLPGPSVPLPNVVNDDVDYLWRAEELRDQLESDDRYFALLEEVFGVEPKADVCLDMLVQLPFRHILTTNYDRSIEQAYERVHKRAVDRVCWTNEPDVLRMMFDLLVPERSARLVYLHGSIADRHSIVLSDRDYTRQYLRSDSTVRKLFAIFAMQRIVFFGFSLRDPDLTFIMRQVAGALGYENARHFAFVGIKPGEPREADRKRLRQKFGIDAIFYDKTNDHQRLKFLMAQLLRECGCEPPASLGSPPPPPAPPSRGANVDEPPGLAAAGARNRRPTKLRSNPRIPDDPRKGMFGGLAVARGRRLSATVEQVDGRRDWFTVVLRVSTENDAPPLKGKVKFYLHHTFDQPVVDVTAQNGEATLTATCYGAFTVGAVADGGKTELELDLATLEAPRRFLEN